MAAPTFVASYGPTATLTGASSSASVTMATGDILVVLAGSGKGTNVISVSAAAGQTWTLRQSSTLSTTSGGWGWTAVAASSQTATFTLAASVTNNTWGWQMLRFSGGTVGTSAIQAATTTTNPSVALTTGGANSAIPMLVADFNGTAVTGATYNTATAGTFTQLEASAGSNVTDYIGYYADAGTAGSKTAGMTAPSGMQPVTIAIEVKAAAAAGSNPLPPRVVTRSALIRAANF